MLATIVDTTALLRTVVAALVTGIGIAAIFSLAILGMVRSAEQGREGRSIAATAFGVLAAAALIAAAAAAVLGIIVMTNKS